jgi:hypothetical protein
MTPRETRAWLAKFAMASADAALLKRLAGKLDVPPKPALIAQVLLAVTHYRPWSFWSQERDDLLREMWPTNATMTEIRAALLALPGKKQLSHRTAQERAIHLGVKRPEALRTGGRDPNPGVTELRQKTLVDWNSKMAVKEIALRHGIKPERVKTLIRDSRLAGECVLSGKARR